MPRLTILSIFCAFILAGCTGARPDTAPLRAGGEARGCPAKPNCVSSFAPPLTDHHVPALAVPKGETGTEAMARAVALLKAMPRSYIVKATGDYVHAEFKSRIFRFGDDLELLLDKKARVIHVRSASRLGYSDLGVNRARVDELRRRFTGGDS